MLVLRTSNFPFKGVNFGFQSHLGCSGQTLLYLAEKVSFRIVNKFVCVLTWSLLRVKKARATPRLVSFRGLIQIFRRALICKVPNPSFNPSVVQFGNNVPYSVTQQPLRTVITPVSSASQVLQFQAGYSRHSVAAIVKVALQPGTSISPISVVNAVPLVKFI